MGYDSFMASLFRYAYSLLNHKFWVFGLNVSFWNILCFGIIAYLLLRLFYRFFR